MSSCKEGSKGSPLSSHISSRHTTPPPLSAPPTAYRIASPERAIFRSSVLRDTARHGTAHSQHIHGAAHSRHGTRQAGGHSRQSRHGRAHNWTNRSRSDAANSRCVRAQGGVLAPARGVRARGGVLAPARGVCARGRGRVLAPVRGVRDADTVAMPHRVLHILPHALAARLPHPMRTIGCARSLNIHNRLQPPRRLATRLFWGNPSRERGNTHAFLFPPRKLWKQQPQVAQGQRAGGRGRGLRLLCAGSRWLAPCTRSKEGKGRDGHSPGRRWEGGGGAARDIDSKRYTRQAGCSRAAPAGREGREGGRCAPALRRPSHQQLATARRAWQRGPASVTEQNARFCCCFNGGNAFLSRAGGWRAAGGGGYAGGGRRRVCGRRAAGCVDGPRQSRPCRALQSSEARTIHCAVRTRFKVRTIVRAVGWPPATNTVRVQP